MSRSLRHGIKDALRRPLMMYPVSRPRTAVRLEVPEPLLALQRNEVHEVHPDHLGCAGLNEVSLEGQIDEALETLAAWVADA